MILAPSSENIHLAVQALQRGECIGLPTETVYGLAADGLNPVAVAKIFDVKKRPVFDPLILHVSAGYDLSTIVSDIPTQAHVLMEKFWPGPLTLILPKKNIVPDLVTSGLATVAVRCPDHQVAIHLLDSFRGPLAAPSANLFGRLSPTTAQAVEEELGAKIALTLDGGSCRVGVESTIVDCSSDSVRVLRLGALSLEQLAALVGEVEVVNKNSVVAPGMLEHHYAPRTALYLCENAGVGQLPPGAARLIYSGQSHESNCGVLSPSGDMTEAAARLFSTLRELDQAGFDFILAELVPELGLGRAINDRLTKARAGHATWDGREWKLVSRG
jgi:L-threonylcarbamoyladenylate synthase